METGLSCSDQRTRWAVLLLIGFSLRFLEDIEILWTCTASVQKPEATQGRLCLLLQDSEGDGGAQR